MCLLSESNRSRSRFTPTRYPLHWRLPTSGQEEAKAVSQAGAVGVLFARRPRLACYARIVVSERERAQKHGCGLPDAVGILSGRGASAPELSARVETARRRCALLLWLSPPFRRQFAVSLTRSCRSDTREFALLCLCARQDGSGSEIDALHHTVRRRTCFSLSMAFGKTIF